MLLKTKRSSGGQTANLFLTELIAVLLFFSISAAILLKVFAAAGEKAEKSVLEEKIILCSQSLSELYSLEADCEKTAEKLFGTFYEKSGEDIFVYFSRNLIPVMPNDSAAYVKLKIVSEKTPSKGGMLSELRYDFSENEENIFFGTCTVYVPDYEVTADA